MHQWAGYQALLDEGVQGRVEFGVRGHRLNESKTEKAVVVYRKDHRLHWKVTAPMPKIVVSDFVDKRADFETLLGEDVNLAKFNVAVACLAVLLLCGTIG